MLMNENNKIKLGYLGTMEGKNMYEIALNDPDKIIDMYKDIEPDTDKYCEPNREFFKVNRNIKSYYIFKRTDGIDIFEELPLVTDTDLFKWTYIKRGMAEMLWAQVSKGYLRFNCSYYLKNKSVHIAAMYEKATLKNIWVNNGDNEGILNAIEKFNAEFEGHVCYSTSSAELKNTSRFA